MILIAVASFVGLNIVMHVFLGVRPAVGVFLLELKNDSPLLNSP